MRGAGLVVILPIVVGLACARERTTTEPVDADGSTDGTTGTEPATAPLVAVRQHPLPRDSYEWIFDATGTFVAAQFEDPSGAAACGVWAVESGAFVRISAEQAFDPCYDWPGLQPAEERSADLALEAWVDAGELVITAGEAERTLPGCTSCGGRVAWAPTGHQLATSDGLRLEVWDADSGERLRSEELGVTGTLEQHALAWNEDGIVVVVTHEIERDCDPSDATFHDCEPRDEPDGPSFAVLQALSSFRIPAAEAPLIRQLERHVMADPIELQHDVGLRWLVFNQSDAAGLSTPIVLATGERPSGLARFSTPTRTGVERQVTGKWRVDASTQWIEGYAEFVSDEGSALETLELGWQALVAEPAPMILRGTLYAGQGPDTYAAIDVVGAAGGAIAGDWQGCVLGTSEDCEAGVLAAPEGCVAVDVSPNLALTLVDCMGLKLIDAGPSGIPLAELDGTSSTTWVWGRGNWLALQEFDTLTVVELDRGTTVYAREGITSLLSAPLAIDHDLLAVTYPDRIELLHAATGEVWLRIAGEYAAAAVSPDGERVALLGAGQGKIIDVASQATVSSFAVDDASALAFRQDGELFLGGDAPTHVIDADTGERLLELVDLVLAELAPGDLDPSWRWIHRADDSVVRTLDFARLHIRQDGVYTDAGVFEGEPAELASEFRFRASTDPEVAPIYTTTQVAAWLRRPGLTEAFFAGEPIAAPRIPTDALAKLDARR